MSERHKRGRKRMKGRKRGLLLAAFMILMIMSLAAAAAAEQPPDKNAVKAEPLKKLFNDVDSSDHNALFINYLADLKIISGYPDGSFKPGEGLTRAQAAIILAKAAGLEPQAAGSKPFADVAANHWAAPSISAAARAGYIKGYPDGSFKPEEKLTQAQGIALVMRLSKQEKRDELPALKDMPQNHWAAKDMATALKAGMIGLSADKTSVYPEAVMTRGNLARALGTLLTKDPGLYTKTLAGTIKDIKGELKLTRNGNTTTLQNDTAIYKGDTITAGAKGTANLTYPDGSSVLIKENAELTIKESMGRAYIKQDGTSGIAVDNVNIDMKKGTLFGALASEQENRSPEKPSARAGETLLASLDGLGYIADGKNSGTPPWYQQAEVKKVKMKIDMPYGVAAVRGTFFLISINWDAQGNIIGCDVSCITGDLSVNETNLSQGTSSTVNAEGKASDSAPLSEEAKQKLMEAAVQQWAVDTALQMEQNKAGKAEMILEIPDSTAAPGATELTILEAVLSAFESAGIQIDPAVKEKLGEMKQQLSEQTQKALENNNPPQNPNPPSGGGGGTEDSGGASYISYAVPDQTYGPESAANPQTINKNIILSAPGITLRNMIITKDLTLGAGIGSGSITLKNVKVQGKTSIQGGGSNSVVIEDSELYTVTVDKNEVRIVAKGNSSIEALTLNAGATLEEGADLTGAGFSFVRTSLNLPAGATIILSGNFTAVNINAPGLAIQLASGSIENIILGNSASGTELTLAPGTSVNTMQINAVDVRVGGQGSINTAYINADGLVMAQSPSNIIVASGKSAIVGGQTVNGGNSQIVTSITIDGPASVNIPATGQSSASYTAVVKDQNNQVINGAGITWSLSSPVSGVSIDPVTGVLSVNSGTAATSCTIVAISVSNSSKSGQLQIALIPYQPVVYGQISNVDDTQQMITGTTIGSGITGGGIYIKNNTLNKWVKPRGDFSTGQIFGCRYTDSRNESCFIGPFTSSNGFAQWSLDLSNLNLARGCEYTAYLRVDDNNGVHQDQDVEIFSLSPDNSISAENSGINGAENNEDGTYTIVINIKDASGNMIEDLKPEDFIIWLDGAANPICLAQAPMLRFSQDEAYYINLFTPAQYTIKQLTVKGVTIPMPEDPQNPGSRLQSLILTPSGITDVNGTVTCNNVGLSGARIEAVWVDPGSEELYVVSSITSGDNGSYDLDVPCGYEASYQLALRVVLNNYTMGNYIMLEDAESFYPIYMSYDNTPPDTIVVDYPNYIVSGSQCILSAVGETLSMESWFNISDWIKSHTSSAANPWTWITYIQPSDLCMDVDYFSLSSMSIYNSSSYGDAQIVKDFTIPNYLVVDAAGNMAQGNITIDSLCYWKDISAGLGTAGTGNISLASSSVAYVDSEHQPHVKRPVAPGEWAGETENWPGSLPSCQDMDLAEGGAEYGYKLFCAYRDIDDKLSFMQYAYYSGDMSFWEWTSLGSPAPNEEIGLFETAAVNMQGMYMPAVAYQHTVGEAVYGSVSMGTIDGEFIWRADGDFYSGNTPLKALDMKMLGFYGYIVYIDSDNNLFVKYENDGWQLLGGSSLPLNDNGGFKANCGVSMAFYNDNPVIAYADGNGVIHVWLWNDGSWDNISPSELTAGDSPLQLLSIDGSGNVPDSLMLAYTGGNENRISVRTYNNGSWEGNEDPRYNDISEPVASGVGTLAVGIKEGGEMGSGAPMILFKGHNGKLHLITPVQTQPQP